MAKFTEGSCSSSCSFRGCCHFFVPQFITKLLYRCDLGAMLSKREFNCALLYARLASGSCAINASWDPYAKLLRDVSWRKSALCHSLTCVTVLLVLYSARRVQQTFKGSISTTSTTEVVTQAVYILLLLIYTTMLLLNLAFAGASWSPVGLFNQLLICTRRLGISDPAAAGREGRGTRREKHVVYLQLMFLSVVSTSSLIFTVLEAHYAYTAFASGWIRVLAPAAAFVVVWTVCILFGLLQMYLFLFYAITKATLAWPPSSPPGEQEFKLTTACIETAILRYKSVYILCSWFNNSAFCRLVVPAIKYGDSAIAMFFMLVGVRMLHMDSVHPALPLAFMVIAVYVYLIVVIAGNLSGSFWKMSHGFIEHLRRDAIPLRCESASRDERKCLTRAAKALPHLRFSVGGAYYMEKKAKLTLAGALIKGTGKLVIAFK